MSPIRYTRPSARYFATLQNCNMIVKLFTSSRILAAIVVPFVRLSGVVFGGLLAPNVLNSPPSSLPGSRFAALAVVQFVAPFVPY